MNIQKITLAIVAVLIIAGFGSLAIYSAVHNQQKLEIKKVELQSTQDKINLLKLEYGKLSEELLKSQDKASTSDEQLKALQDQKAELDAQLKALQAQLQAKANVKKNTVSAASADKYSLMSAAGISSEDFQYVDLIITRESGWRECVRNGGAVDCNYSGGLAYGLCQSLPGSKMASAGDDWKSNPVTQLKWCNSYAKARYGSWANAWNFWQANRWW